MNDDKVTLENSTPTQDVDYHVQMLSGIMARMDRIERQIAKQTLCLTRIQEALSIFRLDQIVD